MKISSLATVIVASLILLGGLLVSGETQADTDINTGSDKTISGDSGSEFGSEDGPEFEVVEEKKRKPRVVCRRERVAGSHMRHKVCRTQESIDAEREATQKFIQEIRPAASSAPG